MRERKLYLAVVLLSLTSIFCTLQATPSAPTADVQSAVSATLTALAVPAAVPTVAVSPTTNPADSTTPMSSFPQMGTISGSLNYPSDFIPAQRVVAFELTLNQVNYVDTVAGQNSYTIDVPVGTYHVVTYPLAASGVPTGLSAGYTQAVPCGLSVSCTDHSLITVTVTAGNTSSNVNPEDWYAPAGAFPAMPTP
jgi:hypothetical protein